MDFESVVKRRRMCREYLDKDVSEEKVDRILDVASRYPSAGHTEPQEFIVVRDQRVKEHLARAALNQMFVAQAPLVIVVISNTRRSVQRYGERGVRSYSITDGAFAAMLTLLAVVEEGLGACFVAAFYARECRMCWTCRRTFALLGSYPSVTAPKNRGSYGADRGHRSSIATGTGVDNSCDP
jgi:nitroreductase